MAKSHRNCYLAITNENTVITTTYDEAYNLTHKKPGGLVKGFDSHQEATAAIPAIRAEIKHRLNFDKPKRKRKSDFDRKTEGTLAQRFGIDPPPKKGHIQLTCKLGLGGYGSTIKFTDITRNLTYLIKASTGKSISLMRLELGYEALKRADNAIGKGAKTVEILGLHESVDLTLNKYAPNWQANNWLNSSGKPPANLELVKSMFSLYEQIEGKVSLGIKPTVEPDTDDLPF